MATIDSLSRELVQLAMQLHQRRVWERVPADAPFLVRHDGEDEPLVCFVIGQQMQDLGLTVLRGSGVVEQLEALMAGAPPSVIGTLSEALMVSFEARQSIPPEFQRVLNQAGFQGRRESAAPLLGGMGPGRPFGPMGRPQMRAACAALRATLLAERAGRLLPRDWDRRKRRVLELTVEGRGKQAHVLDRVVVLPKGRVVHERSKPARLGGRSAKPYLDLPRLAATWIVATLTAPGLIEGESLPREVLVVVDERSRATLALHLLPTGAQGQPVLDLLTAMFRAEPGSRLPGTELSPGVPERMCFVDDFLADLVGPALASLRIEVVVEQEHEVIEDMLDKLGAVAQHADREARSEQEPEADDLAGWKELDRGVTDQLVHRDLVDQLLRGRALARFAGTKRRGEELLAKGDPHFIPAVLEWFLCDYRATVRSSTLLEKMLQRSDWSSAERRLLEARRDGVVSIFRVVRTEPAALLEIEDVLTGATRVLHDRALSTSAPVGVCLPLRVYSIGEWTFCTLAGPPIPQLGLDLALSHLQEQGLSLEGGISADRHLLGRLWSLPSRRAAPPVLQNTDGDPFEQLRARFRCADPERVARELSELEGVHTDDETHWTWNEARPGRHGFENGVVMAYFELIGDELLATVNSRRRLERVREHLGRVSGLTFEDARAPDPGGPEDRLPGAEIELDPEFRVAVEKKVRETALAWLDQPVPALDGRTPRRAWRDPGLRKRVEQMVRTYPDSMAPWGLVRIPREEMLRDLRRG